MFNPNSGEPFGLPKGTVRGTIALALTGTLIQQVLSGAIDPITFIGVAGPFLGWYVADRQNSDSTSGSSLPAPSIPDEPLAAPYVPISAERRD